MTYIDLINHFWAVDTEHTFSGTETKLYFAILAIANSLNWKEPLSLPNTRLLAIVGCTEHSLIQARQRLIDVGLIAYKHRSTREAGLYFYTPHYCKNCSNQDSNSDSNSNSNVSSNSGSNSEAISDTYIRQDKRRQDKEQNIYLNQNTDLGTVSKENRTETFSKKYPEEYQKVHKDLQAVIDLYELVVRPLKLDELPVLVNMNQHFTAGQIRAAIQRFSGNETVGRFKEQGLAYILEPLNKGLFGKRKEEQNEYRHRSNVKDAIKGPRYENRPDLSSLKY
jgi:hypothetical protein